jgi:recombination protein RecT
MREKPERPKYEVAVINAKPMFLQIDQGDESRWNKELVFALQIVRGNDLLQKCLPESIMNAIVNIATIDVSLNPALALAYLVPRDGKCVLDISYRGLIKIGTDSGSIRSIQSNVVYSFDEFDYSEGTELFVKHKRSMAPPEDFLKDPLGNFWKYFVCAYSVATLHDGSKDYMIMPKYKIEKIRNTSKIKSEKGPWGQWPEEMSRKTVIKYHYKTLPQSEKLGQAVAILNDNDGIDFDQQKKDAKKSNLMDRFTADTGEHGEVIDVETEEIAPCEFCDNSKGEHGDACPNHPDNR